jgi:uncharacterized protein
VHGDELNGVPVVHKLVDDIDPVTLVGTIVAIPVVNGPGFLENKRGFSDGVDLNRCFPGTSIHRRRYSPLHSLNA